MSDLVFCSATELAEAIRKQDRKVLTTGKPMTIEREMTRPDGETRNEVSTKFPIQMGSRSLL